MWAIGLLLNIIAKGTIGEVIDIEDNDYLINFLEKSGKLEGRYKRPRTKDDIWCDRDKSFGSCRFPLEHLGALEKLRGNLLCHNMNGK